MESFLNFFETMPNWQKFLWVITCISISWMIELGMPLMNFSYKKWKHATRNFVFLSIEILINALFGLATVGIFYWISGNQFGLLNQIDLPVWAELVIAVAALDFFAQYLVHFMLHKVNFMWRFHLVHHSDTQVDVSSATRHHPIDYLFREVFALIAIFIFGIPLAFYLFYRILTVFFAYTSHANIFIPLKLDKVIGYLFVTPNMHKFHHHRELPWTDSNFGNILSIWDRMFGTLTQGDPRTVVYGLDIVDETRDQDLAYQFKLPFDRSIKYK